MADATKFTEEEIKSIDELRNEVGQTFTQLGQLSIQKNRTLKQFEAQEEQLLQQHQTLAEKEQEIFKSLNEKYGDGNFDPKTGTFTPTPKEETAKVEG